MARSLRRGVGLAAAFSLLAVLSAAAAAAPVAPASIEVAVRELPQAFAAEGTVEAVKQATVGAQATGRVIELAVKAGDAVRAGQLIARIDAREADQAVAAAVAAPTTVNSDRNAAAIAPPRTDRRRITGSCRS